MSHPSYDMNEEEEQQDYFDSFVLLTLGPDKTNYSADRINFIISYLNSINYENFDSNREQQQQSPDDFNPVLDAVFNFENWCMKNNSVTVLTDCSWHAVLRAAYFVCTQQFGINHHLLESCLVSFSSLYFVQIAAILKTIGTDLLNEDLWLIRKHSYFDNLNMIHVDERVFYQQWFSRVINI